MQSRYLTLVSILLVLTNQACLAEENNYFWEFGLHGGGDRIPTEEMAPNHTDSVEAGGLFSVSLGTVLRFSQRFSFTPTLGIKYNFNQSIFFFPSKTSWKTTMLNLPIAYRFNDWRLGVGVSYHYKPTLSAQSDDYSEEWQFDNSLGSIIKLDYFYDDDATIGLQHMQIDYTRSETKTVNGDNIALIWRILFSLN